MRLLHLVFAISAVVFGPLSGSAQVANLSPEDAPSLAVVIAEEPRGIDPATLIAPQLAALATVEFEEQSLSDVADWIQQTTGLQVVLNERALEEYGILTSEPVTDAIQEAPVYLLLDRLESMEIGWRLATAHGEEGGIVRLEPIEDAVVLTRQYNVGDLIDAGFEAKLIKRTIINCIEVDSWDFNGGEGGIVQLGDVMFVRQSQPIHLQVAGLLQSLRGFARRTLIHDVPQHELIRERLGGNVSFEFDGHPLSEAVSQLAEQSGVSIVLDELALRDVGIRARQPIELSLQDQSLRLSLDLLCEQYDMEWQLKHGRIEITRADELGWETAVYDVRDLCRDARESKALLMAVMNQTIQDDWVEFGGVGTIEFPKPGVMVVYQTQHGLDEVLQLLESYRAALRQSKPRNLDTGDPILTRFYRMPTNVAQQLVVELPKLVSPSTWQSAQNPDQDGTIQALESWPGLYESEDEVASSELSFSVLRIQQTQDVHTEISNLLYRIRHGEDAETAEASESMGSGGFGGGFFRVDIDP